MRKFLKVDGKIVGDYDDVELSYTKKVARNKHRMWKYDAYGIQESVIKTLKELGCNKVIIQEVDTGSEYTSYFIDWLDVTPEEFGHGLQRFLPVKQMRHYVLIQGKNENGN